MNTVRHRFFRRPFKVIVGSCVLAASVAGYAQFGSHPSTAAAAGASGKTLSCAPTGELAMPAGVNIERLKLLDQGQHFKVYTSIEASDDRDKHNNAFPPGMSQLVDLSPSSLNRILADTILRSKRFKVFDMRPSVTAEQSDVLITAKVVDADQVLRPYLEGGRRVSESRVKLSVQVKNMYTGENLLPSDALVEGKTGAVSGDRVVVTSAEDVKSPEIRQKLAVDFKNAMYRAFSKADERIEDLLRPMARVVSAENCRVDLFGGSRMGMQANDELVLFRSEMRQLGDTTVLSNTRPLALVRCSGVGTENSQCIVVKAVAGFAPQDGDYAVVTEESMQRAREQ